jgi:hypothetical protein
MQNSRGNDWEDVPLGGDRDPSFCTHMSTALNKGGSPLTWEAVNTRLLRVSSRPRKLDWADFERRPCTTAIEHNHRRLGAGGGGGGEVEVHSRRRNGRHSASAPRHNCCCKASNTRVGDTRRGLSALVIEPRTTAPVWMGTDQQRNFGLEIAHFEHIWTWIAMHISPRMSRYPDTRRCRRRMRVAV